MKRPKFFEDLDRSLAGENPEPEKDAGAFEVQVSSITRRHREMRVADAEAMRMATYAMLMQQAPVRISVDMACLNSATAPITDFYPEQWRKR